MKVFISILTSAVLFASASSTYALADEAKIVIVSKGDPGETLTEKTLERIFLKKKGFWKDGRKIVPVNLPPQYPAREVFTNKILKKSHRELVNYWNEQYFNGTTPPVVMASEEAVKAFVRQVDGALGYISTENLEPDLKVVFSVNTE